MSTPRSQIVIECSICKTKNGDKALYCFECGQRLMPQVPQVNNNIAGANTNSTQFQQINLTSSGRLHSPILDLGGQTSFKKGKNQFAIDPDESDPRLSVSHNGLHSPLLDGRNNSSNTLPIPGSGENIFRRNNTQPENSPPDHFEKSRLHSPVLDGAGASFGNYFEETYTEEEYQSLRSPLLKAKVPLPEKAQTFENVNQKEIPVNQAIAPEQNQDAALPQQSQTALPPRQTVIPQTQNQQGPMPAVSRNAENIKGSRNINDIVESQAYISPLSISGINKLTQNRAGQSFDTGRTINQSSLLPNNEEALLSKGKNSFNKGVLISLIFTALAFKIWYLISLGSAVFGSLPFACDQGGQVIALLIILVLLIK